MSFLADSLRRSEVRNVYSTEVRKYLLSYHTFEVRKYFRKYFRTSDFRKYSIRTEVQYVVIVSIIQYDTVKQLIISYYCICMKIDTVLPEVLPKYESTFVRTKVLSYEIKYESTKVRKYFVRKYVLSYFRTKVLPYFLPNT